LIEVIVSLTLVAIILTATLSVTAYVTRLQRRDQARATLLAEGIFVAQAIEQVIAGAGTGVPAEGHIVDDAQLYAPVLVAAPTEMGVVGDFPRPHTQYNTFGILHPPNSTTGGGDAEHIAFHNENNGNCLPPLCAASTTSLFFNGDGGTCNGIGDRLCPWGLKRIEGPDRFMIVSPAGDFTTASFANSGVEVEGGVRMVRLNNPWNDLGGGNEVWLGGYQEAPYSIPGIGFVTTLDRVFLRQQGTDLQRIQCWGDPVPGDAAWPDETTNAVPTRAAMVGLSSPYAGGGTNDCTQWETLTKNVQSVTFTYFAEDPSTAVDPTTAGGKRDIRRIDYQIILSKTFADTTTVQYPVVGSMAVNSL